MSTEDTDLSDESLNAIVDGEYPMHEQAELMAVVQADASHSNRMCALRSLKVMVQNAYAEVPAPAGRDRRRRRAGLMGVAASLALGLAAVLGVGLSDGGRQAERFVVLDADGRGQRPAVAEDQETRIVFHLLDGDMDAAGELLDEVENLLADYRHRKAALRIEVVAHSDGLALLRRRLSSHQERVASLARTYPNLAFVACSNTVRRLRVEKGLEVTLIPEARETASGVTHVVRRQQEGWAYIKV